jgi:hypothetical protein
MSAQALMNAMMPPEVSDEERAEYPWLDYAYAIIGTAVPDNDRCLIGPGHIPALNEHDVKVELPGVYESDAKTEIENFWRCLKAFLRGLPGTVRGP